MKENGEVKVNAIITGFQVLHTTELDQVVVQKLGCLLPHHIRAAEKSQVPDGSQLGINTPVTIRDADGVQRSLQLLHLLVKQIISLLSLHFLSEPRAGDINGWSGFLILEKHLCETFAQAVLTFLK